jgi:L,D-transpeptidase ErfK/SrfK
MTLRIALALMLVTLGAAAARAEYPEQVFMEKTIPSYTIPTPAPGSIPPVVGRLQVYRIRKGDTLMDLARLYSLGYNEIVEANPYIDPWVPPVGATIILPTEWILPCCTYNGIMVNIPEMRLFYMRPGPTPGTTVVNTYPVGLGRDDWRTPEGKFKIAGKTVNPPWNIPESIRQEHIRERGDARTFIPGGDPDNPLGKHRLELTLPAYRIHGTNIPWGVGMQVSHGCVRLYPEDIERLFPLVPVGTSGEFVYQPVKIGQRGGRLYAEFHEDIYGQTPAIYRETMSVIEKLGLTGRVDGALIEQGLEDKGGSVPFPISAEGAGIPSIPTAPVQAAPAAPSTRTSTVGARAPHPDA